MLKEDDLTLISECQEGNNKAFETLIERYQKAIFNAAYRMVNDYDDASDITQLAFIKAFENLDRFNPEKKFFSWVYKIMVNESLNFIKRQRNFSELPPSMPDMNKNPDELYHNRILGDKIDNAVYQLDIDHKVIIVLRHFGDLSYNEISFILDLPEKTVKSRLFSARKRLCDILQKKGVQP